MSALTSVLDGPAATALAWTLLHFLWQGAALAAAFLLVARYARLASSARYTAGVMTLAAMLVAPVATYLAVAQVREGRAVTAGSPMHTALLTSGTGDGLPLDAAALRDDRPVTRPGWSMTAMVVGVWALGVCVLAMRLAGGWMLARRLVHRAVEPASPEIQSLAVRIASRLALDRIVRVAQSSAVAVPVMVGWLKPVVLFPAAVLAGLTPTQIEALLAHELAHVRRHDYVVNLLQSVVETLLFYHPAVWWVSRRVRIEREHCCDDLAIGVCDRLVYATALSELASLSAPPRAALAATDGSLLERVRRILGVSDHAQEAGYGWVPVLALVIIGTILPAVLASANRPVGNAQSGSVAGAVAGTVKADQGGVAGGVPGGVAGGVQGGVRGGVQGGVPGGVLGAVPGSVRGQPGGEAAVGDAVGQGPAASEAQRRELIAKMEAIQREAKQRAEEIQKALHALELQRLDSRTKLQIAELSAELDTLQKQQVRMKQQVEVGMLSPTELGQVETRIVVLGQQIAAARTERTLQAQEIELRAAQARQQAELARAMEEYVSMRRQYEEQAAAAMGEPLAMGAALLRDTAEVGDGERIRAGDVLVIEFHGEPDVPRAYSVHENGTIKLPLSAPLRVLGLTARQVEQDLVKQLTARGLERPAVDVRLRRHRAPDGR